MPGSVNLSAIRRILLLIIREKVLFCIEIRLLRVSTGLRYDVIICLVTAFGLFSNRERLSQIGCFFSLSSSEHRDLD